METKITLNQKINNLKTRLEKGTSFFSVEETKLKIDNFQAELDILNGVSDKAKHIKLVLSNSAALFMSDKNFKLND